MHVNIRPVKLKKPSGTTLVTVALLILLPTLAVLQYQWVGQLSTAARERLQRNVRIAAAQFREAFDGELIRAILSLQVGPQTVREGVSERYSDRYNTWLNTASHPQIVSQRACRRRRQRSAATPAMESGYRRTRSHGVAATTRQMAISTRAGISRLQRRAGVRSTSRSSR